MRDNITNSTQSVRRGKEEALGGEISEEAIGALLSQFASELGINEDSDDGHGDNDRPEGIRLNPFADSDESGLDQTYLGMDHFVAEGGVADEYSSITEEQQRHSDGCA